eukprot:14634887-Ditylum_brightwellii.AAC.1
MQQRNGWWSLQLLFSTLLNNNNNIGTHLGAPQASRCIIGHTMGVEMRQRRNRQDGQDGHPISTTQFSQTQHSV